MQLFKDGNPYHGDSIVCGCCGSWVPSIFNNIFTDVDPLDCVKYQDPGLVITFSKEDETYRFDNDPTYWTQSYKVSPGIFLNVRHHTGYGLEIYQDDEEDEN